MTHETFGEIIGPEYLDKLERLVSTLEIGPNGFQIVFLPPAKSSLQTFKQLTTHPYLQAKEFDRADTRARYLPKCIRLPRVPPTIVTKRIDGYEIMHESLHMSTELRGWTPVVDRVFKKVDEKNKADSLHIHGLYSRMDGFGTRLRWETAELLERSLAAKYGFINNEIHNLANKLQYQVEYAKSHFKKGNGRKSIYGPHVAMILAFSTSTLPFCYADAFVTVGMKSLNELSNIILSYYADETKVLFRDYEGILRRLQIPPNVRNLSSVSEDFMNSYRPIVIQYLKKR